MPRQNSKSFRQRGVMLTTIGYQKLLHAKIDQELAQDTRCTLDSLSQQTGLTANTLSKIFTRSSAVDKRSLYTCFAAFHLDLEEQDYLSVSPSSAKTANGYGVDTDETPQEP